MKKNSKDNSKDNKEISYLEVGEDATQYGEFISSYFAWVSLPNQKERVEELESMTNPEQKHKRRK